MKKLKLFHPKKGENSKHAYHSVLENKINEIITPFQGYINHQVIASIFLLVCTIGSLLLANSQYHNDYRHFINLNIGFHIGDLEINQDLIFWVNDVLLTLFFFFVGLEIKRELLVGELKNRKTALFIIFSAVGGMVIPACIYLLMTYHSIYVNGWGIPMATDTAFALGVLTCLKRRISKETFTFIAALAIVDDIGSIIVIALFYTKHINQSMLLLALVSSLCLVVTNYAGIRKPLPYFVLGLSTWFFIESAGIHGAIAGIIVAFIVPARPQKSPNQFLKKTKGLLNKFEAKKEETPIILKDQEQHEMLEEVQEIAQKTTTPLQRWKNNLELPIMLVILPLFAFVNSGLTIHAEMLKNMFQHPISLGIVTALVIGKPLGIMAFSFLAIFFNIGHTPGFIPLKKLTCTAFLTGIGFTMSFFITNLSFHRSADIYMAKAAILLASLISALLGVIYILLFHKNQPSQ